MVHGVEFSSIFKHENLVGQVLGRFVWNLELCPLGTVHPRDMEDFASRFCILSMVAPAATQPRLALDSVWFLIFIRFKTDFGEG